jgi:phage terminase
MNNKEKKFAELYIQSGNAVKAAVGAGYSEKTARFASNWLNPLKPTKYKSELAEYIDSLNEQIRSESIMSAAERQEMLSSIAKDENELTAVRIRAIDTLNKMDGQYINKVQASVETSPKLADVFAQLTVEELTEIAYNDE